MIVYKAVRKEHDKLLSVNTRNQYCVEYSPREITYPKIGKLFAFSTDKDWIYHPWHGDPSIELWRAKTSRAVPICHVAHIDESLDTIAWFWDIQIDKQFVYPPP